MVFAEYQLFFNFTKNNPMIASFIVSLALAFVSVQPQLGKDDYSAKFKIVFEAAKKHFKTEKTGTGTVIADGNFVMEYTPLTRFDNAELNRVVIDKDQAAWYQLRFAAGTDKAEAEKKFEEAVALTKTLLPTTFAASTTYSDQYNKGEVTVIEYKSDVFAEVVKRPGIRMGLMQKDAKYSIEILVMEAFF